MPHQCTSCGRTFPDGSKEMLSGCPDCGGNKFQFKPAGATDDTAPGDATSADVTPADEVDSGGEAADPSPPTANDEPTPTAGDEPTSTAGDEPTSTAGDEPTSTAGDRAASTADNRRDDAASTDPVDSTPSDASAGVDSSAAADGTEQIADRSDEDTAQASARSDVVSPDELDRASREVDAADTAEPAADEEPKPGIDALRDELNEQFESIRIVSPGQYELNLMELYDRQEYIISLQEDGRYVIEMPDAWGIQDE